MRLTHAQLGPELGLARDAGHSASEGATQRPGAAREQNAVVDGLPLFRLRAPGINRVFEVAARTIRVAKAHGKQIAAGIGLQDLPFWIEQDIDHAATRLDEAADAIGEIIRQSVRMGRVLHHAHHPLLQLLAGGVQPVVNRRSRKIEEHRNVLVRAFVHEEERRDLA